MDARKAEQEGRLTALLIETPAAMANAITPHPGSIWRYALSLSGKPDLADDLTQTTVLRAMEKHLQFRRERNLTAWCFSLPVNLAE
jgi:DNA-directed RNA polymerase specialized sigma24 family protein